MKKLIYLLSILLLTSCSSEENNTEDNTPTLPKVTKLTSKHFDTDGNFERSFTYSYFYNKDGINEKIDAEVKDLRSPIFNRTYTTTIFFKDGRDDYELLEYTTVDPNLTSYTVKRDFTYTNDMISSIKITNSDDSIYDDTLTYNTKGLVINRIYNTRSKRVYNYEYDTQDRLIKSIQTRDRNGNTIETITEFKYLDVLNPFYNIRTSYAKQAFRSMKYIRASINEEVTVEKNEFNLPTKLTYSTNGKITSTRTFEY